MSSFRYWFETTFLSEENAWKPTAKDACESSNVWHLYMNIIRYIYIYSTCSLKSCSSCVPTRKAPTRDCTCQIDWHHQRGMFFSCVFWVGSTCVLPGWNYRWVWTTGRRIGQGWNLEGFTVLFGDEISTLMVTSRNLQKVWTVQYSLANHKETHDSYNPSAYFDVWWSRTVVDWCLLWSFWPLVRGTSIWPPPFLRMWK